MRPEIIKLLELGPLPSEADAETEQVTLYEHLIGKITPPVTDEEAKALVSLFDQKIVVMA